jgi:glycerophosphoryl diester phosphodiesterase
MTVLAIAHRAGNSLAGLHAANLVGADVVECDVHEYRGRLEVRHLKTAGPLPFLWDRWALASSSAPRLGLGELLAAGRHGATFMLDLKGRQSSSGRAVAELIHEEGHHRDVFVCGRHWPSVDALAVLPYVRRVLSARTQGELARLLALLESRSAAPPAGTSVHRNLLDAATVVRLRRRVDLLMTWPVNDLATLDHLVDLGATGIITDSPEVLAELVGRRPT